MIISDKYQFVFIHIPKCGGLSIRSAIQSFDDTDRYFTGKVENHPKYGLLDYVHIPLFALKESFPDAYSKIKKYNTFCIIRNPYERFMSSLSQHLKIYGNKPLHLLSKKETEELAFEILSKLESHDRTKPLPAQYAHFHFQYDYIFVDNDQVVSKIFRIGETKSILAYLAKIGLPLNLEDVKTINKSLPKLNRPAQKLITALKPIIGNNRFFKKIYSDLINTKLLRTNQSFDISKNTDLKRKLTSIYSKDIELWEKYK